MMDEKEYHSYQSTQLNQKRRKQPIRRIWSRGLPSLATNTVRMVVATLQIGSSVDEDIPSEEEDDEDTFNIGQQVQAYIPDIVLNNLNDLFDQKGNLLIPNEHTYNHATLLFLDVSGFTSLTEQYSNDAHLGVDQLTHTLNSYFNKLVSEILIHHGDIYKFAGDAILALWTNEVHGPVQALKCALYLQEKYGAYETDVGVVLRLKVALAYGSVRVVFIGTEEFKHYILIGDCVKDVNRCEQICEPGDIIITKNVYEQVQSMSMKCEFVPIKDENELNNDQHIAVKSLEDNDEIRKAHERLNDSNMEIFNEKFPSSSSLLIDVLDEDLANQINVVMKSFLLRCVYQRLERKQSLDYLSELRRVTISFINLDISDDQYSKKDLYQNVQKVFIHIYELTKMLGGVLTKALLFDKGWSFLCVFGLPGYTQGDDTANALKCAYMIHSTINKQYQFIDQCSIGVTTGLTYCGVVGHIARCEYTVIGRKVNMAARLMCNYPNIISCDQETYYNSRLNSRFFQILPDKILKGMHNVGIIWQYDNNQINEQNKDKLTDLRHDDYPFLGRRVELMIVAAQIMLLDEPLNSSHRRRDLAAIIFEGDDKIGRSRLLQFIAHSFEQGISHSDNTYIPSESISTENTTRLSSLHDCSSLKKSSIRVISYSCQLEQRFNEFALLRSLLRQLLRFTSNDNSQYEREQTLLRLFDINKSNDLYLRRNLFLLNDLLDVRFRRSHIETENNNEINFLRTYEININEFLLHILNQLIESSINTGGEGYRISSTSISTSPIPSASKILFIIDDIHFADESSLKHLLTLGSHWKCLLILSMKPPTNNNNDRPASNTLQSIRTDSRVYLRRLPGLELRYIATLGCQILSVHKLPGKLVKILNESCNGIPGFCEQILFDLLQKDKIYITDQIDSHEQESNLIEGDPEKLFRNCPNKNSLFKKLFSRRKFLLTDEQRQQELAFSRICLLRDPTVNDFAIYCQQNFQNYIMCRIDRLSEGESLLIKIAAVIGNSFSRTFLWQLVDPQSKKLININSCILDMMQRTVLECAYRQQQVQKSRTIKCFCLQNLAGFPSQCRLMTFTHVSIREGIYNSLTDSLKRMLTRNAIDYLEKQCTVVCLTCGPRNDNPFFVQKQDDLTRIIKTNHQHAFVDIVKMVALKEIDNTIKQLIKIRSLNIRTKQRSNTSSNVPLENVGNNTNKVSEKRRNSFDTGGFDWHRRSLSADDYFDVGSDRTTPRDLSSPNLTVINVYPRGNNQFESISSSTQMDVQQTSSKSNYLFRLFRCPRRRVTKNRFLKRVNGLMNSHQSKRNETLHCFRSFFRFIFCRLHPLRSNAPIPLEINYQSAKNSNGDTKLSIISQENEQPSHWRKVRQALIPTPNQVLRACPNDNELLEQSMFSSESMQRVANDLNHLNKQIYLTRTFQTLYEQSLVFHTFQSYVQYKNLMQYIYQSRHEEQETPANLNEFITYNDLRICQCADYVLTVYIKLVEYHTNLYEMYEKLVDDRRDYLRRKQFNRIIYYRLEICRLLLRLNYSQRLLVEISNGRKILDQFQNETSQYILAKYTYNLFETIVLQRTRSIYDAKILCEESLKIVMEVNEKRRWEKLTIQTNISAKEKRIQYVQSKDYSINLSRGSQSSQTDQFALFTEKYHLEYLICQYHLVRYQLSRHQSIESINTLIDLQYHTYPITFSLPCTIILIEYFYCQMNYSQCLLLINRLITFWWSHISTREKLELGKLKTFSLIIELKHTSLESAILSGYFAKRLLTGCHENIFLIETCIHLTLALIGEMRISNIELILQHLEYLSEQTMNCYAKLWYYILVIDVAIELGYELLPITIDFLENITKYRKKLLTGPYQRSLLIVYSDCTLAQIYIRLGILNLSKIHFQQALHQIKYDQMHLSNIDFRFKRGLLKLIECQLLYWYYSNELEEYINKDSFLLSTINEHVNEKLIPWNRTRFCIYQAYYDRLVNEYKRQQQEFINDVSTWQASLDEAEINAVKLDREWIKRLRIAWLKPVSEQVSFSINHTQSLSRPRTSTMIKSPNRQFIRPSIPHIQIERTFADEIIIQNTSSEQKFVDWRLFLTNNTCPQFQLYILPVRV